MKTKITLLFAALSFATMQAQSTAIRLCDFDTVKRISFSGYNGQLDTMMLNPNMTGINTSSMCARYVRSTAPYDNIKFYVKTEFVDVNTFAQASTPNKIMLNVLSNMPAGTRVEVQLGAREIISYPEGIHSVYHATTTATRQWETLNFNLSSNLSGNGGFTNAGNCNKLVVLFNPNSTTNDTIYFDDVMGPQLKETVGIKENINKTIVKLSAVPNPANEVTTIKFATSDPGKINLEITDVTGRLLRQLNLISEGNGEQVIPIDLSGYTNGVYFYTLKKDNYTETRRLVVSH